MSKKDRTPPTFNHCSENMKIDLSCLNRERKVFLNFPSNSFFQLGSAHEANADSLNIDSRTRDGETHLLSLKTNLADKDLKDLGNIGHILFVTFRKDLPNPQMGEEGPLGGRP